MNYKSIFTLGFLFMTLYSCKRSPQASENNAQFAKYVLTQNAHIVSSSDDIYITFKNPSIDKSKINSAPGHKVIKMTPKVDGEWQWVDRQTLKFIKAEALEFNTKYTVTVNLNRLYDQVPAASRQYVYNFDTENFYFKVDEMKLENPSAAEPNRFNLKVDIKTNFDLTEDVLPQHTFLTLDGIDHEPTQFVKKGAREFSLTYGVFEKKDQPQNLKFRYNVRGLKVSQGLLIPAKGQFTVLDMKVMDNNAHFQINFSDPLAKQNFDGLVDVIGYKGTYKFSAKNNVLDVYLNKKIVGNNRILLYSSIKSVKGQSMTADYEKSLLFESAFPAIRTVASGNIVPYDDKVIFPFEAISIDTVDVEVFKIFENNVMEFLRHSNLKETTNNRFLGRVVHHQTVALKDLSGESNANVWKRYALDLKKMTDIEPGAIYQIRIGFKRGYTFYPCENDDQERMKGSTFANRYYNYDHRNNPCYNAFYRTDKFVYRNVLASNLGLIAKAGKKNKINVYTSDLKTGDKKGGVNLQLFDEQQQLLETISTNGEGMAVYENNNEKSRRVSSIIASAQKDYAYLHLNSNQSNSLSEFDVSGANISSGLNGFIYGERGVWRPGDTLHLSFMITDMDNAIDKDHPARVIVKDSKGQQRFDVTHSENENGLYVFQVPTSSNDPTGLWTATAIYGNYRTSKRLKVETIKPNRIKVDLVFSSEEVDASGNETFGVNGAWLHGAPAADLKTEIDIKYDKRNAQFENYKGYAFSDPTRKIESAMTTLFKGNLNAQGQQSVKIKFGNDFKPPGKLRAQFRTRVYEKSGNYSEDFNGVNINPYTHYAGVYVPESRWRDRVLNVEKNEKLKFVSVDKNGKASPNRKLSVGIYEARWRWWYNRTDQNIFRFNSTDHFGSIEKKSLVTNAKGEVELLPTLNGHGTYLVRVCDEVSGHCSGQLFYTSSYGRNKSEQESVAKLDFTLDKTEYQAGEDMKMTIPTSEEAKLLVTIENNTEVLQSFWVNGQKEQTEINLPVTSDMTPNVYVHIMMIQGTQRSNDLPTRLYGVVPVKVVDKNTVIEPMLLVDNEIRPNRKAEFTVKEAQGMPMSYTLAVVDEGLLDITNFKTPKPWDHFFKKQSLGVRSWDIFDFVLNKYGGKIEKIISIGGDAEGGEAAKNISANRFKPVVTFLGPFTIGKNGSQTHTIDIPNYVGSLRCMVVAKNDIGFGSAEKNVTVKDPLMVKTTLPRVLAPGETLSLPVNVFAYDDKIKNANITLEHTDNVRSSAKQGSLQFERQGDKLHSFDITVGDQIGIAAFDVQVASSSFKAHEAIEIDIRNPSPEQTKALTKVINKGESHTFEFDNIGLPGTGKGTLELSLFPDFNLNNRLKYLVRYPYGCVEQTTSSVFPQLYLDDVADLEDADKVTRNIEAGIRRLVGFQRDHGGLSYWRGSTYVSDWGTNYAGHFMIEAKKKGYYVSDAFMKNWTKYQKSMSKKYRSKESRYGQRSQAYRLYTLALAGSPDLGNMNNLRLEKNLQKSSRFLLAGAYAVIGQNELAAELIDKMDFKIEDYNELGNSYGSGIRDRAILLMTLNHIGKKEEAFRVGLDIAEDLASGRWYSTQSTAFALLSLTQFLNDREGEKLSYDFVFDNDMRDNNVSDETIEFYTLDIEKKKSHALTVNNTSGAAMYVRLAHSGKPAPQPTPSFDKGLQMKIQYKDEEGTTINPTDLKLGTDFKAVVSIKNISKSRTNYEELALNHTLPSGWEIQNLRVGDINTKENAQFDHQDIRDDRVYTFFDLKADETKTFVINLTAAYAGKFFMPNVSCEAMYNKEIASSKEGGWVTVQP